jgi:hypothetical protein
MISTTYKREEPSKFVFHRNPKVKKDPRGENDPTDLTLQEWDPRSLPDHFFMTLEGKRRTGKSTFAKWLLQWYQHKFSLVWCMTLTKASGYWQQFVGEQFTFDNWNPDAVLKLIERGDHFIKKYGEDSKDAKRLGSSLIILDDVISANIHNDFIFNRLATEGRHHLISVILMTQDPHAISPKVRDNSDVAVVFNLKTFRNKESIWRDFMNDVDKETALVLLAKYAVEHDALVCVQTNLNDQINKNFFKSTGDKTKLKDPNYCLGSSLQAEQVKKERADKERLKERLALIKAPKEPENSETEKYTVSKILS